MQRSELKSQKSIFMVNGFNSFSDLTLQTIVTFICVSFLYLRKKPITAEFIVFAIVINFKFIGMFLFCQILPFPI
jgi:hypothetical protein